MIAAASGRPANRRPFGIRPAVDSNGKVAVGMAKTLLSGEAAEEVFRTMAKKCGSVPPELQKAANVDEQGNAGDGGVTVVGRRMAADMPALFEKVTAGAERFVKKLLGSELDDSEDEEPEVSVFKGSLDDLLDVLSRRRGQPAGAPKFAPEIDATEALKGWPAFVVGLGLAAPIRAAVHAAARALTVALDDGASDDAGINDRGTVKGSIFGDRYVRDSSGARRIQVSLGGEPFVLLRAARDGDGDVGVTMIVGGEGLGHGRGDLICPEQLLSAGRSGVQTVETEAEVLGVPVDEILDAGVVLTIPAQPEAGSGNGPRTEDPYGNRGDAPASRPAPPDESGDDGDLPPDSCEPAADPGRESSPAPSGE